MQLGIQGGMKIENYQRDGVPTSKYSFGNAEFIGLESTDIYERIEVIRGSTGLTNGTGNPSASINYVRKKPTKDFQGDAKVSYGSWDTYKGMLDISGGLNEDKSIRGRLVASYKDGENQQDRYKEDNSVLYAALDFDLSDNTLLTTALSYQKLNSTAGTVHGINKISLDGKATDISRSFNPAPNWAYSDIEKTNLALGLEHYFNNDWKAVANYNYTKAKSDRIFGMAASNINYTTETIRGMTGRSVVEPDVHSIDLYTTGNIKAFEKEHKLSFGVNGYSVKADDPAYGGGASTNNTNPWQTFPLSGYNGDVAKPDLTISGRNKLDEQQIGAFAALNIELAEPLHLILGSRVTNFERVNNKGKANEQTQKHSAELIPYLGLTYDINDNFTTYASYTSIFNPVSSQDIDGNYLEPEKGNTAEFGVKSEFYDGRLNTSLAYFITKQDNKAVKDGNLTPSGVDAYKSIDGAEIKGWDLTIGGEILPNWNMQGGYTYTDAKDEKGDRLSSSDVPKQTLKLFTTYKYNKLTVGGGVNWQSDVYSSTATTPLQKSLYRQKAYALVNAMAKYDIKKDFSVILNVNNLFDEKYSYYPNQWSYGEERNFNLALNYKF